MDRDGAELATLTKDELVRVLDAARAMARASSEPDYEGVLHSLLEITASALESESAVFYMFDEAGGDLVLKGAFPKRPALKEQFARLPVEGTATGRTFRAGVPAAFSLGDLDPVSAEAVTETVRYFAIVPLRVRGVVIGTLTLVRVIAAAYQPHELRVAQILAELFVVYVETARLYTDAQRRFDETRMILDVGRAVTASLGLQERLESSAEGVREMLDASNAFILLLDERATTLRGVASADPKWRDYVRTVRLSMDEGSSAVVRAAKTRVPVMIPDTLRSDEVYRPIVEMLGEKSLLTLPLLLRGESMGVFLIDDTRRARVWTASEIERAELIALQVASAVANARLFEEVKQGYEQLARAQAELLKRERLVALGQLAATLAHEVRNPLGVLFNSLFTLEKMLPSKGDAGTLLAIMGEEARRLDRLVRELLDFARPVNPTLEPESLRQIVTSALDAAAREMGPGAPAFSSEVPSDFPYLPLDAAMMRRALVNLLVNGAQAAGPDGDVIVRARAEARGGRMVARIEVADTGPGIAAEVAPRVFEPFFTTKATGTGLGLAIVKGIVEAHAGELELHSVPGDGTTVVILLPMDEASDIGDSPAGAL